MTKRITTRAPGSLGATKALTVRQPWASWIIDGSKNVENRTWQTKFRGRIAIHAGAKAEPGITLSPLEEFPLGVILGTVEIVDCVRDFDSAWAMEEHWHWVLADPQPADELIRVPGALGFWDIEARTRLSLVS